jgi:hypothetical protein
VGGSLQGRGRFLDASGDEGLLSLRDLVLDSRTAVSILAEVVMRCCSVRCSPASLDVDLAAPVLFIWRTFGSPVKRV